MKHIDFLDSQIVIAPMSMHSEILKYKLIKPSLNFKLMSKEQIIVNHYGTLQPKAIVYIMKKLKISFENALLIAQFVPYGLSLSSNNKIRLLGEIKDELISLGYVIKNEYFDFEMRNKRVLLLGYGAVDIELDYILKYYTANISYLPYEIGENLPKVIAFSDINEEVFYVLNEICFLVENGEKIDDIVIVASGNEYVDVFNKLAVFFEMPQIMDINMSLYSLSEIQDALIEMKSIGARDYLSNHECNQDIDLIVKEYSLSDLDEKDFYAAISSILKTKTKTIPRKSEIHVSSHLPYMRPNRVFLLGFNQGNYPQVQKDNGYMRDCEKSALNILTSKQLNHVKKQEVIDFITNQKNLTISYKTTAGNTTFYPSSLIKELKLEVVEPPFQKFSYSKKYSEIVLASFEDNFEKFSIMNKNASAYHASLTIPYKAYDYRFKGIKRVNTEKRKYSYSRLSTFFKCQFAYYCASILKLDVFEETFFVKYGKFAHEILENVYSDDYNFDEVLIHCLKKYDFDERETCILMRRADSLKYIAENIREHFTLMQVKEVFSESQKELNINHEVTLFGIIDRMIITTDGEKEYYSIIDYKTGPAIFEPREVAIGYSLQLPIYTLLVSNEYNASQFAGVYYQPIAIDKIGIPVENAKNSYAKLAKLRGFSINNEDILRTFDPTYEDSLYIQSMKLTKDGAFNRYAKIMNLEELESMQKALLDLILEADAKIQSNDFMINPKIVKGKKACENCSFAGVCFKSDDSFVEIELKDGDGDVDK